MLCGMYNRNLTSFLLVVNSRIACFTGYDIIIFSLD